MEPGQIRVPGCSGPHKAFRPSPALLDTIVENDPAGLKSLTREELVDLLTF